MVSHDPLAYSLLRDVTERASQSLFHHAQIQGGGPIWGSCFENLREIVREQFPDFKRNMASLPTYEQAIQNQAEAWALEALRRSGLLAKRTP